MALCGRGTSARYRHDTRGRSTQFFFFRLKVHSFLVQLRQRNEPGRDRRRVPVSWLQRIPLRLKEYRRQRRTTEEPN